MDHNSFPPVSPAPALGAVNPADLAGLHDRLLGWYAAAGRDLPWRRTHDPYAILVSEIMLQQTGVERVLPKYHEFLARFPTVADLAAAPTGAVIRAWAGLGYNMRAVRLQGIARQVVASHGGIIPSTVDELLSLTGIGSYTAGAVACFAFGSQVAFLDTNIRRVLGRVFLGPEDQTAQPTAGAFARLAEAALPADRAYDWHQALMDLGATICTVRTPTCLLCPLGDLCVSRFRAGYATPAPPSTRTIHEAAAVWDTAPPPARRAAAPRKETPFTGSTRYYRGRIIATLRAVPPGDYLSLAQLGQRIKSDYEDVEVPWLAALVRRLSDDGLLEVGPGDLSDDDPSSWLVALPA
jgi:A/G-specific adenine glycosylase